MLPDLWTARGSAASRCFDAQPQKILFANLGGLTGSVSRLGVAKQLAHRSGRNGERKSTLLQMICGTLIPPVGAVRPTVRWQRFLELGLVFNRSLRSFEKFNHVSLNLRF